jgi:hypothetical protein
MDPSLCGSTAISHNAFQISGPIEPQEASPMQHEMNVLGIDIANKIRRTNAKRSSITYEYNCNPYHRE